MQPTTPTPIPATTTEPGLIGQIAEKVNVDSFLQQFNLSTVYVLAILSFFAGGALTGFLAKRYLKAIVVTVLLFFLFLKGMEYLGVSSIAFNWARVKELTGISPTDTVGDVFRHQAAWVQLHIGETVAAIIGFIVGIKLS